MLKIIVLLGTLASYFWVQSTSNVFTPPETNIKILNSAEIEQLQALNLTVRNPIIFNKQTIHGRFLHITDIHPDPYYKVGSKTSKACHRGNGKAGKYGDAISGCDSPLILMNDTIAWIDSNLKDKIDFIVWTGDNARHDNDRKIPRTETAILETNQILSDLMYETFKNPDTSDPRNLLVDLIPSVGNNDVYPHNVFAIGPNSQTRELYNIWLPFVPQNQLHTFNRGAYFFKEIIPGQLAILSINTLYLFQSNPLVDNCDNRKEPGYKLFNWLSVVLKEMRSRNMKVWLTGHVPPNEKNYDISCLRKYIIWSYEYRDMIIGGLYGHMNIDHFIPLDSKAAYKSLKKLRKGNKKTKSLNIEIPDFDVPDDFSDDEYQEFSDDNDDDVDDDEYVQKELMRIMAGVPKGKVKYMNSLRTELYGNIKKKKKSGVDSERYSIAHVSASVIPTFNPGFRVWEYNITGLNDNILQMNNQPASWDEFFRGVDKYMEYFDTLDDLDEEEVHNQELKFFDYFTFKKDKTIPPKKPADIPLGPAYTPQVFSPIRYTQYFADLKSINKGKKPFKYEYEYSTDDKHYNMESLLVKDWLKLGRKLGKPTKSKKAKKSKKLDKLWQQFLKNSFIDSDYENLGYG